MGRKVRKIDRFASELRLNSKFYKKNCVLQTIEEFRDVCSCKLNEIGSDILILIKPKSGIDSDLVGYEFSNYVLGLMKNLSEV